MATNGNSMNRHHIKEFNTFDPPDAALAHVFSFISLEERVAFR
jgi:hypothetical protein